MAAISPAVLWHAQRGCGGVCGWRRHRIIPATWRWGQSSLCSAFWLASRSQTVLPPVLARQGAFLSWSLQALPRGSGQHCPFKAWPQSLISVVTGQVVRRYRPGPQGKLLGSRARRGSVVPGSEALPGKCSLGHWPPFKGAPWPACRTPAGLIQSLLLASTGCTEHVQPLTVHRCW